eukprot:scaffold1726_cov260-Pinguiococcus_pyrenoidosus.AAC.33
MQSKIENRKSKIEIISFPPFYAAFCRFLSLLCEGGSQVWATDREFLDPRLLVTAARRRFLARLSSAAPLGRY